MSAQPTPQHDNDAFETSPDRSPVIECASIKGKVEAALFITRQPLSPQALAELVHSSISDVQFALMDLMQDYAHREDSALEINDENGYILQVREPYQPIADQMMPMDLSTGALRTLALVALKGPILQSELVQMRGSSAYDHIAELLKKDLVKKKREQRSYRLSVTQTFHDYFQSPDDGTSLAFKLQMMAG
jgi:segregation and condensation protein B